MQLAVACAMQLSLQSVQDSVLFGHEVMLGVDHFASQNNSAMDPAQGKT